MSIPQIVVVQDTTGRASLRRRTWCWLAAALAMSLLAALVYLLTRRHRALCLAGIVLCGALAAAAATLAFAEVQRALNASQQATPWRRFSLEALKRALALLQLLATAAALAAIGLWWFQAKIPGA